MQPASLHHRRFAPPTTLPTLWPMAGLIPGFNIRIVPVDPSKVLKVSKAAYGLASWVKAMDVYDRVAKVVGPKKEALAGAEAELKVVMDALAIKQAELKAVVDKLASLDTQLTAAKDKKFTLEAEFRLCSEKLERAGKLIGGLGGEKVRWTASKEQLGEQVEQLTGNMLLAAGCVAYFGPFTAAYRSSALQLWESECAQAKILCTTGFSLTRQLGDPVKIRQWQIHGLPNDAISSDNAVIIANSRWWSLCIDPQSTINKWIRATHAEDQLVVLKQTDVGYLRRLETALQLGQPVLMESLHESIDNALDPILLKQRFKSAGAWMVKLGDTLVEWPSNSTFRLYLTTKLRSPHYSPEVCTKVCCLTSRLDV
jgi:dynein heavy chain, axonemal